MFNSLYPVFPTWQGRESKKKMGSQVALCFQQRGYYTTLEHSPPCVPSLPAPWQMICTCGNGTSTRIPPPSPPPALGRCLRPVFDERKGHSVCFARFADPPVSRVEKVRLSGHVGGGGDGWGTTSGPELYAKALVQKAWRTKRGDVGRKPYCWQNRTQERAGRCRCFQAFDEKGVICCSGPSERWRGRVGDRVD